MPDAQFDLVESYDTAPQSDWFHACRESKKPYVTVRTGEQTADVMWDYVTLPPSCDSILLANEGLLREQAIAIFEKHASVKSSVRAKATSVFFDNLPIPEAKLAANELYTLIESLVENPAQSTDAGRTLGTRLVELASQRPEGAPAPGSALSRPSDYTGAFHLLASG